MPEVSVNGARLHYEEQGSGRETIVFSHGLLMNSRMFRDQIDALSKHYRCIAYDHRGQGRSAITRNGYDMDTLTEDAAALIDKLDARPCHFAGLSMGGFVGLRMALRHPEMLRSLILLDTSADEEPRENITRYRLLNWIVRLFGVRPVVGRVMPLMFGRHFLQDPAREDDREQWRRELMANRRPGVNRAVDGVISRAAVYSRIDRISHPTLVIVGEEDAATPLPRAERLKQRIPDSELVVVPKAGHSSTVEQPEAVTRAMAAFLDKVAARSHDPAGTAQ